MRSNRTLKNSRRYLKRIELTNRDTLSLAKLQTDPGQDRAARCITTKRLEYLAETRKYSQNQN